MTSFYIITTGSSHTISDAEQMTALLQEAYFTSADSTGNADILIFNTCTGKGLTEAEALLQLEQLKSEFPYKVIIVVGCLAPLQQQKLKKYPLVGPRKFHHIVEAVEEALHDDAVKMLEAREMPPLTLSRVRKNSFVGIIPISRGCFISGNKKKVGPAQYKSYPINDIRVEVEKAVRDGVTEILLTSADTAFYGYDIKTNLPALLRELVQVPGPFKLRLGILQPDSVVMIKRELLSILSHDKILKFLYTPLYSGSNVLLKQAGYFHTVEQYHEMVSSFRSGLPELTLMTDIIVGHPAESDEQHWETLNVLRKIAPDIVNISKWTKSSTAQDDETPLPDEIVSKRVGVVTDIYHNIAKMQNERWMGWKGEIIITEKSPDGKVWIGRNKAYKPIIVEGNFKMGDLVTVVITRAATFELRGEVIKS